MNLIARILAEPELQAAPPVLVDIGAAGGVHRAWRQIARHAVGVGFEPDAREAAALTAAQRQFLRWVFCPALATPVTPPGGQLPFHLTRSPQCSSMLPPDQAGLSEWVFADQFEVLRTVAVPAASLTESLQRAGIDRVDWLKCDTQGMDLKLYQSLPTSWRQQLLVVEFEPGFIDSYQGEDHVAEVLVAMKSEPFWLAGLTPGLTPRGRSELMGAGWPAGIGPWLRRLAPPAPAWAGLQFLRDVGRVPAIADRRGWLLAWVFAVVAGQPGYALTVAEEGRLRFGSPLFGEMVQESRRQLRWAMVGRAPGWLWRRLFRSA
jgi:FkbM family methyltransferase